MYNYTEFEKRNDNHILRTISAFRSTSGGIVIRTLRGVETRKIYVSIWFENKRIAWAEGDCITRVLNQLLKQEPLQTDGKRWVIWDKFIATYVG